MERKRVKVVMLPTAIEPFKMPYSDNIPKGAIIKTFMDSTNYNQGLYPRSKPNHDSIGNYSKQMWYHLYFLSDDEIKEGDWVYDPIGNRAAIIHEVSPKGENFGAKKIIASTDPKLRVEKQVGKFMGKEYPLPQPSKAFIEKYCKLGGIDEVEVEMEYEPGYRIEACPTVHGSKLKVNSHNEIAIHSIKDSWNREEVVELLHAVVNDSHCGVDRIKSPHSNKCAQFVIDWSKQNV